MKFKRGNRFNKNIFLVVLFGVLIFSGSFGCNNKKVHAEGSRLLMEPVVGAVSDKMPLWLNKAIVKFGGLIYFKGSEKTEGAIRGLEWRHEGFDVFLVNTASRLLGWSVSAKLYEDVFFSATAREGITMAWKSVRGFVNMFYLLILIFLAIATILRINKFGDQKLFFNVIISAILVNFSLPITLVVIDFSNLIMTYFASAIKDVGVVNSFYNNTQYATTLADPGFWTRQGTAIAQFIINIVMGVMIFFTAVALLIRLVAYWVLIILSPLAFFCIALPNSSGFNEWRDKLMYYSFFGPIMLFFIWLALALSTYLRGSFNEAAIQGEDTKFVTFIISYIVVLYLLYYGHDKSKTMAAKAGEFAGKVMTQGGEYAVKMGKGAGVVATLGAPLAGKYAGEYLYTGMKKRMEEGKYTRLATSEGRKKAKEDFDRSAEYRGASPDKKEAMEFQQADTIITDWKKEGKDVEREDFLKDKLLNGNKKEKNAAMMQLATLGKLGKKMKDKNGVEATVYNIGKEQAGKNKFFNKALDRSAGKNSEGAMLEYYAKDYTSGKPTTESREFIKSKMKDLIEVYNKKHTASYDINYDSSNASSVDKFMKDKFAGVDDEERVKRAINIATAKGKTSIELSDFINKGDSEEIGSHVGEYLQNPEFDGEDYLSEIERKKLSDRLNSEGQAGFRRAGIV